MAGIAISDVVRGAELAWQIYQIGWGQQSGHQYEDFGKDIRCLSDNLNNIRRVVENATDTWARNSRGSAGSRHWDLSSLDEIIGDYHATLKDCKQLLEENREFRTARNFAYNIEWTLMIQPKVTHLRKRLDAHNSKIAILLKPLELNLLSEIHHDLAARIDAVHQSVLHLHGLLIPDVVQAISDKGSIGMLLQIPPEIESRFRTAAGNAYLDASSPVSFPLRAGADALVTHLEESTKNFNPGRFLNERSPSAKQYLNLLKCIWIAERLEGSGELAAVTKDSQWPGYIAQLKEEVSTQCQRFNTQGPERLLLPNMNEIQGPDDYSVWVDESIATLISPHVQEQLEEVLKIPLPCPQDTQRHITVYKIDSTRYRLVEAITENRGQVGRPRSQEFSMEIDLRTLSLTPLYATPSSQLKAPEVLIHSGSTQTNPTFPSTKHVYQLQHLLTGYKVYERYDQAMIKVQFVISGQSDPLEEHGRIQLWMPKPYQLSSMNNSPSASETQSMANNTDVSLHTVDPRSSKRDIRKDDTIRHSFPTNTVSSPLSPTFSNTYSSLSGPSRRSVNSTPSPSSIYSRPTNNPTPSPSSIYSSFKSSIYSKNRTASIMTSATSLSKRTASSVSTISTGKGKARLHEKPTKPLLVIFLKSKDATAKLALVAIELDDITSIMQERCNCRTAKSKCTVSCIERAKGSLLAQRWNADRGLSSWNVAALGMEQRTSPSDADWHNITRISLRFQSMEGLFVVPSFIVSCLER
ncbi:uncharacterized protein N0V89_011189 [Didymosphaeria variabile]|uniref:Uncharacterized protein n=1 Tax=Didymosphaeria variabile TaxID=1932322 RepID=A0A9W8XEA4_9PLEO|nr:uncharacterized protein N0V89_011189 [Didymosphaeria variabile]KAJ4347249.1 hypothetical protein N0V89_011189 [Didymosphaeria variabile]